MKPLHDALLITRRNIPKILAVAVPLLICAYFFFVNEVVISIRMNELKNYLQDTDKNEGGIDHISLIATYEIHKKIYEERISQDDADIAENRISTLLIPAGSADVTSGDITGIPAVPALYLINFNRRILGKPPVSFDRGNEKGFRELDQAYYCERNFLYKKAIVLYDRAIESKNFNSRDMASILLRQGYCYALAGYNDMAMKNYNTVITEYSEESSAITASILIRYLEGFTAARERVLLDKSNPVLKSRKLVNLLAYEQALKIIGEIESKAPRKDIPEINYFKARCYNGLGEPEKAAESYLAVVTSAPGSPYARYSNRRLYMMGESSGDSGMVEISKSINEKLHDPVLAEIIEKRRDEPLTGNITPGPVTVKLSDSIKEKVKKFTEGAKPVKDIYLVIITKDGNTFKGKLAEKKDNIISIETSIGRIEIRKEQIIKITGLD